MRLIEPIEITDAVVTDSNVPEDDHPEWSDSTAYEAGDRVISLTTHRRYEAIQPSTDVDPTTDDGTTWLDLGATARWSVFDRRVGTVASQASPIHYQLTLPRPARGLALLAMSGVTARVRVTDTVDGVVYDETFDLIDNSVVVDAWTYCFEPFAFQRQIALFDVPGATGSEVDIWIAGPSTVELGQIVVGNVREIGTMIVGTTSGIIDFSRKDRDEFGNAQIVERAFVDRVTFQIALSARGVAQAKAAIARNRARATIWSGGEGTDEFGTTVYGFYRDLTIDLVSDGIAYASLEVEGLV